jgi:hypothetical protein
VLVGTLALCLSIVGIMPGAPFFYYSAGGILAVIGGARALGRSRAGLGTSTVSPVLAILLGSLAVLFMVIGFVEHVVFPSSALNDSYGNSQTNFGAVPGSASQVLPPTPTWKQDASLTQYETSATQIALAIYATYNGGSVSVGDGVQPQWPTGLTVNAQGVVSFPTGTGATTIPGDEVVTYVRSSDGTSFDIAVAGGTRKEVAIYDSATNRFSWVCYSGASPACPAGGLDPSSTGPGTSNS